MNFDSKMPIYLQIMDEIKRWIVTDVYQPSQKIPSVRELAVEFGVNPNTVQRALSELERSGLVASERTSGRFICNDTEKLIEISGLSKAYGKKQALHNVDMVFEGGQIIGLLGPNGSGKTTLLKVMTGLLKDYDGVVKIDGTCIGAETKAMVSYLPDEPYFSDWMKVKDALAIFVDMYADFDLDKCLTIMRRFQIDDGMRIKTMSKGTKEKFQLALVMSRKAKIIVLDEPIGGVDPAAREVILDTILENYSPEQTILIATHLIADIERIFSTVVFIKNGQIVLNSEVEDVRQETGKSIDELFREEFRY